VSELTKVPEVAIALALTNDTESPTSNSFRSLSPGVQRFFVATMINMVGNGMLFAFLFIYFTDVRKFSSSSAGWIITAGALTQLLLSSPSGSLVDRVGAKRALELGVAFAMVVFGLYSVTTTVWAALAVSITTGIAQGLMWPAQQAFANVIVPAHQRPMVSSWLRIALNIGAGIGATIAGFIVSVNRPATFTVMFLINVATFVVYLAIITTVPVMHDAPQPGQSSGTFRDVLRDKFFVRLLPLDLAAGVMFGMAFMVMPTTFVKRLGASESMVGLVVMSGTVAVITTQMLVVRYVTGRARMVALGIMFALFATSFVLGTASVGRSLSVALVLVVAAQVVGGVGEAFLGPTRNPLTADMAPPELMGRYFGLQSMMFMGGFGVANGLGGVGLDVSYRGTWMVGSIAALAAMAWSIRLDRTIPAAVRLSP
jgi:MFS family permease